MCTSCRTIWRLTPTNRYDSAAPQWREPAYRTVLMKAGTVADLNQVGQDAHDQAPSGVETAPSWTVPGSTMTVLLTTALLLGGCSMGNDRMRATDREDELDAVADALYDAVSVDPDDRVRTTTTEAPTPAAP